MYILYYDLTFKDRNQFQGPEEYKVAFLGPGPVLLKFNVTATFLSRKTEEFQGSLDLIFYRLIGAVYKKNPNTNT